MMRGITNHLISAKSLDVHFSTEPMLINVYTPGRTLRQRLVHMLCNYFHYSAALQARANRWERMKRNDIALYIGDGKTRIARIDHKLGVSDAAPEVADRVVACYCLPMDFLIINCTGRVITTGGAAAARRIDKNHILRAAIWSNVGAGFAVIIPFSVRAASLV